MRSVLTAVLAAAVLSAPSPSYAVPTTSTATAPAPAAAAPAEIRIGTYNIRADTRMKAFKRGVRALRAEVDVAGLQEIGSNKKRRYLERSRSWGYFRPARIQQNPVIWRRSAFALVRGSGYKIAESRSLGDEPSGGERKKDSTATVVRLRHRATGQRVVVINVHLVKGAVKAGRPWPGRPRTFDLYADQVAGLVKAVRAQRSWGRVFALGDFNVGFEADERWRHRKLPFRKFRAIGFRSMWQGSPALDKPYGTHQDALIDQVWTGDKPVRTQILRSVKVSDHKPAVATYRLPVAELSNRPGNSAGFLESLSTQQPFPGDSCAQARHRDLDQHPSRGSGDPSGADQPGLTGTGGRCR